jgi:hypothetical protein
MAHFAQFFRKKPFVNFAPDSIFVATVLKFARKEKLLPTHCIGRVGL